MISKKIKPDSHEQDLVNTIYYTAKVKRIIFITTPFYMFYNMFWQKSIYLKGLSH